MDKQERVMELALRRGFLWPSYEIYGGASGFYDYGPMGALLKRKIEEEWRRLYIVGQGFLEISTPTVSPEEVFVASGHVKSFVDPMVECEKCGEVYKADQLIESSVSKKVTGLPFAELDEIIKDAGIKCVECGGRLSKVWSYNLMFKTHIGPGSKKVGYLRPETAQGMFTLFHRLYAFNRKKLPFGVAQIGRAYRNEISPRQGVIRLREFTQAEVEVFVHPKMKNHPEFQRYSNEKLALVPHDGEEKSVTAGEAVKQGIVAHELLCYHLVLVKRFLISVGLPEDALRFRQHMRTEMAHYAVDCWDAEARTDRFGWIEVVGIADRTSYDLSAHEKQSGQELAAFVQYDEPVVVKKKVLTPKMDALGKRYKGEAALLATALKGLDQESVKAFEERGYIDIALEGEKVRLSPEYAEVREVEEKLHGEKIIPHVIEPSFGIDRILYVLLENAYNERDERRVLSFNSNVAPMDVAVFPLIAKDELIEISLKVVDQLKEANFYVMYDDSDSIGRRYSRADEVGVPYALTVDFDTIKDSTITIRERDSMKQQRIRIADAKKILMELKEGLDFEKITAQRPQH